ncbi:MAG: ATP-binding protein [Candidatus Zixiibacteriota bacterium]
MENDNSKKYEESDGESLPRYKRLRSLSILLTSLVALIPLFVMVMINYYQDQNSYHAESRFAISRVLSNTNRTLEYAIDERRAALSLVISQQSYQELSSDVGLRTIFQNLNNAFGGFVDLGLIDSSGNQAYYSGPYDLKGRNYKNQEWFSEVLIRGEYVSEVFMGHRNLPHFIIAFRHEKANGDFYVLRATIDMEMINRIFYSLDLDKNTDAFLISSTGVLQTNSLFYGAILTEAHIDVPQRYRNREVIDEYNENDKWITAGYAYIENSPFILMVIKQRENPFLHWFYLRTGLLWFLFLSTILILGAIVYGSSHTIKRLRELDKRRARILHNVEYTSKMATIGRMASSVAHEINNPLAIINEKAGLLTDLTYHTKDLPNRDKYFTLAESITKSVERCSQVTHRLLGFARRMDNVKEFINLKNLIEDVVEFQKTEMSHRHINININIPEDAPPIESDRGQMQQVFLNIINNAVAAVESGGHISIDFAEVNDKFVDVSVTDDGVGISEKNLKSIFEPFYSTKGEFGTGLGLSITHDIIQKFGGDISVTSKLGKGTKFVIRLPRKANY